MIGFLKNIFGGGAEKAPTRVPTFESLDIGDVVLWYEESYIVIQKITYHQAGFFWYDYRMQGDTGKCWLAVENDDELVLQICEAVEVNFNGEPPPTLEHDGATYKRTNTGKADAVLKKEQQDAPTRAQIDFWNYEGPHDQTLEVIKWAEGDFEVSLCKEISETTFDLLGGAK